MRRDFARSIAERSATVRAGSGSDGTRATQPALSAQQSAALAALAVRHGEADLATLRGPAREMFATLTNDQLRMLIDSGKPDVDRRIGTSGGAAPRAH